MKKAGLFLCLVALALCACVRQPPLAPGTEAAKEHDARWQAMLAANDARRTAPFRMQMSLRFGSQGDTRRVTALLWGNDCNRLRLDVMAGVGAVVGRILDDGEHFLLYAPTESKAYFHQGMNKPLLNMGGVPMPLSLATLTSLLDGAYADVFGRSYSASSSAKDGLAAFTLSSALGGELLLDKAGMPKLWRETPGGGKGWVMDISPDDGAAGKPGRLSLRHSNGKIAVLLVKERETPARFAEDQLKFSLPPDVPVLPIAQYKSN
ncbi:MAG: hypothetical protein K6F46_08630 [Desulfovibrio sp.]|nr:hypothetical protein [Desulfovibrio sp.]